MKLFIALDENKGLDSKLSFHFGRCNFFGIFDSETNDLEIIKNPLDHSKGDSSPANQLMVLKPEVIISRGIGSKAIKVFEEKQIPVKVTTHVTLKEIVDNVETFIAKEE